MAPLPLSVYCDESTLIPILVYLNGFTRLLGAVSNDAQASKNFRERMYIPKNTFIRVPQHTCKKLVV